MSAPKLVEAQRAKLLEATPPLRFLANRHPECSGLPWGWVEDARGHAVAYWSGERPSERAAILDMVNEINAGRAALHGVNNEK